MEISKTDLQKVINYLNDAAKLYDALPMQSMKCRAHMIRQLVEKLNNLLRRNAMDKLKTIPDINILETSRDGSVNIIRSMPEQEVSFRMIKTVAIGELVWDYTDTILDIVSQRRIDKTKELSRAVRAVRRSYEQLHSHSLRKADTDAERDIAQHFEDVNRKVFSQLVSGLRVEIGRMGLSDEDLYLVQAVQMAMTVIDALRLYDRDTEAWVKSYGVDGTTFLSGHFAQLARLLPQYAGDCYDAKSESRRIVARMLYNDIKSMQLINEKGEIGN